MEDEFNWISLDDQKSEGNNSDLSEVSDKTHSMANDIMECVEQTMNKSGSADFLFRFDNHRKVFVRQSATCMDGVTRALYEWWMTVLNLMEAQVDKVLNYRETVSKLP